MKVRRLVALTFAGAVTAACLSAAVPGAAWAAPAKPAAVSCPCADARCLPLCRVNAAASLNPSDPPVVRGLKAAEAMRPDSAA